MLGAQEGSKCYAATLNAVGDGCRSSQAARAQFPVSYEARGAAGYFPGRHRSPEREPSLRPLSQEGGSSICLVKRLPWRPDGNQGILERPLSVMKLWGPHAFHAPVLI